MKDKKATLKDIAAEAEVSLSTVHKALYNKPGISERVRKEILAIADGMGYKTNYVASSLKRKLLKIAFVVPLPNSGTNRYYYRDIWKGMRAFQAEAAEFNIEILDFGFSGPLSNLPKHLEEVYQNHCDEISGLVTLAVEDPAFTYFIDQFSKRSVPAVFIVSDLPQAKRLCCVRAQDLMAGSLAAELISGFTANKGKALVVSGDIMVSTHYMNVTGFEQYFAKAQNRMDIIKIYNRRDPEHLYYELVELLRSDPEISAIYSCTATNTPPVCKAVLDAGRAGTIKVIGSDLFQESREMLLSDVLQAIIYKKPFKLGYLGCRTLFNFLVKNEFPRSDSIFIEPIIVLKSNLPFYERDITADNAYETI
ncbi:transcriptional regulator, LacI family [Clostridium sp. MSTE9]|uniref:LacI family DNA-binding transcriptional regulator n=1 Tax=Clostridium sp. (strain MSTE9) TaxID=1105031 RepID=UPI00026F2D34|nr:LacI family DNA-binding transcriptional regulator [Clostridium sp. MSTE9]EJF38204.1 transcriptional regulator, LacI family [Clostridium sp. MSTE9]